MVKQAIEVVPKEVAFAAAKLDAFNRNRYRIETTGATTAGPSSIVTINLPDAAVLDLRTLHMDVLTRQLQRVRRVRCVPSAPMPPIRSPTWRSTWGGVQVQQGIAEYNTATRMFKIPTVQAPRATSPQASRDRSRCV